MENNKMELFKDFDPWRNWYILTEDHKPIRFGCDSGYSNWEQWMRENLHLKFVSVSLRKRWFTESKISTVFLGLDHNYGDGPPVLFETLVFGGPMDQEMWRYVTWKEAEEHHKEVSKLVEDSLQISNYLKWLPKHFYQSLKEWWYWNVKHRLRNLSEEQREFDKKVRKLWRRLRK